MPVPDPRVGHLAKESLKVGKRALPAVRKRQEQKWEIDMTRRIARLLAQRPRPLSGDQGGLQELGWQRGEASLGL